MIKANFNAYSSYVTDSLYQWDLNQRLSVTGLNLSVAPEVHFSNANMDRAIVRQAEVVDHVVNVEIPNSLLQDPLTIRAHIGIYEGATFKVVEMIEIPVIARKRPLDYQIETSDEEIYSFKALEAALANKADNAVINARVDNIIAHNNDTDNNSELVDLRLDINGDTHKSAGEAVRNQLNITATDAKSMETEGFTSFFKYAKWIPGSLTSGQWVNVKYRLASSDMLQFDRNIIIRIADGFRVGVHFMDKTGAFLADSGWQTSTFTVRAGTYFKMVIARTTEITSETATVSEFSSAITFDSYIRSELDNLNSLIDVYSRAFVSTCGEVSYPTGHRFTSNHYPPDNNRIHAKDIVCESSIMIVAHDKEPGYYYGVDLYTNDGNRNLISASGWMKMSERPAYIVSQNCVVDIVISRLDDKSFSDLSEMDGLIETVMFGSISDVKEKLNTIKKRSKNWLTSAHRGFVDQGLKENTLGAYYNAYLNGADMIETDARLTRDGVLICNHDPIAVGVDPFTGDTVSYTVAETDSSTLCSLILSDGVKWGRQTVPTLDQVLNLAYHTGLIVNIDLKNGAASVDAVLDSVLKNGMKGRVIYALNGSGVTTMSRIIEVDPDARFIDTLPNFATENFANIADYEKRCFVYTDDFSDETIAAIRSSGCMLALISLNSGNFETAIKFHPEMCEYLHTADFKTIEADYFERVKLY